MSLKSKGINAERDLIHKFWAVDWAASRVAGSGSTKYPAPDILAGNTLRKLVIECKVTKQKIQYFSKKEVEELQQYATMFGAEPWCAIKFDRDKWYFLTFEDLKDSGKSYSVSRDLAKMKGLSFEEIIK
jgi:Holliday junction resolvase